MKIRSTYVRSCLIYYRHWRSHLLNMMSSPRWSVLKKSFGRIADYINAGAVSPDSVQMEIEKWSDIYWQIYEENPGKHAARLSGEMSRSEEHTSELQSRGLLVCRLLREQKKRNG